MHRQQQANSGSQPTNGAGNRNRRRHDVIRATMAFNQPTLRVGNLDINRRRHDVLPGPIGSGLGKRLDESGSSQTLLTLPQPIGANHQVWVRRVF